MGTGVLAWGFKVVAGWGAQSSDWCHAAAGAEGGSAMSMWGVLMSRRIELPQVLGEAGASSAWQSWKYLVGFAWQVQCCTCTAPQQEDTVSAPHGRCREQWRARPKQLVQTRLFSAWRTWRPQRSETNRGANTTCDDLLPGLCSPGQGRSFGAGPQGHQGRADTRGSSNAGPTLRQPLAI